MRDLFLFCHCESSPFCHCEGHVSGPWQSLFWDPPKHLGHQRLLRRPKCGLLAMTDGESLPTENRHCEHHEVVRSNLSFAAPRYQRLLRRPECGLLAMTDGGTWTPRNDGWGVWAPRNDKWGVWATSNDTIRGEDKFDITKNIRYTERKQGVNL